MSNHLANEPSPYLQQHKDNPVDWYPWDDAALTLAQHTDKPIFLSIGYSSCHWCHVMAHQSFENPTIASAMNDWFVNIKVDREERPDLDAIYMSAVQAMTRHGGWPLNVFLTPDGIPFFGGVYWPPHAQGGLPGFSDVLEAVHRAWTTDKNGVLQNAARIHAYLEDEATFEPPRNSVSETTSNAALNILEFSFDPVHGGFGSAPKFPQAPVLEFLALRAWRDPDGSALSMLTKTLDAIAAGGIHDQVGGGFARYSVDAQWLVPHFEKMLYDNAQFISLYTRAWRLTRNPQYEEVVERTIAWAEREMRAPTGGYFSALDADSEGEEGRFYLWSWDELENTLTPDQLDFVVSYYGVTRLGNFEGSSILSVVRTLDDLAREVHVSGSELRGLRDAVNARLLAARSNRVHPATDTKVIVSWNALMIKALAEAGSAWGCSDWVNTARHTATFLIEHARYANGSLGRTIVNGSPAGRGVLEDYAALADALIALYRASSEQRWLEFADSLATTVRRDFTHTSGIGYFDTARDHELLVIRPRDIQDSAMPSGNAMALDVDLALARLHFDDEREQHGVEALESAASLMAEHPAATGRFLAVLERRLAGEQSVVICGNKLSSVGQELEQAVRRSGNLFSEIAWEVETNESKIWPQLASRGLPQRADAAAFVCQGKTCLPPIVSPDQLTEVLGARQFTQE